MLNQHAFKKGVPIIATTLNKSSIHRDVQIEGCLTWRLSNMMFTSTKSEDYKQWNLGAASLNRFTNCNLKLFFDFLAAFWQNKQFYLGLNFSKGQSQWAFNWLLKNARQKSLTKAEYFLFCNIFKTKWSNLDFIALTPLQCPDWGT